MSETSKEMRKCELCGLIKQTHWTWYLFDGINICPFCYSKLVKNSNPDIYQLKVENTKLKRELLQWESLYGKYPGGPAIIADKVT